MPWTAPEKLQDWVYSRGPPSDLTSRRTAASPEDAVAVAPANEDEYCPDSRPIDAGRPVEEGAPEPLQGDGIEAGGDDGLRAPQGVIHGCPEAASNPAIKR